MAKRNYGTTSFGHIVEVEHGRGRIWHYWGSEHGDFAHECQCALAAYHQVGYNVERVFKFDEWQNVEPRNVFDGILVLDKFVERTVVNNLSPKLRDFFYNFGVRHCKSCARVFVGGVEHGAVVQHNSHRA